MKKLLVLTAVVMLSASAIGCGGRLLHRWRSQAACCNPLGPTTTFSDPYLAPPPAIETVPGPAAN